MLLSVIENDGLLLLIEHFNLSIGFSKLLHPEGQFSLQHLFLHLVFVINCIAGM